MRSQSTKAKIRKRADLMRSYILFLSSQRWWIEKALRAEYWYRFVYGHQQRNCTACSGSGYYDNNGSPKCSSCDGTGKEKFKGPKWEKGLFEKNCPLLSAILTQYRTQGK